MKRYPASALVLSAIFLAAVPSALAHPGHDGHELTWDFNHLSAHPLATISCFIVIGTITWMVWRALRPAADTQKPDIKASRQDR